MLRDVTTMDDGRRITYYYSAPFASPAQTETPDETGSSTTSEAEQR